MLEELVGIVEEIAGEVDVFEIFLLDGFQRSGVEAKNDGFGEGHQNRRVGGDDELTTFGYHSLEQGKQGELAQRRKRHFRLIEQIETIRDKTGLEEGQETLAMGVGIQVSPVLALHGTKFSGIRALGKIAGEFRAPFVFLVHRLQLTLHLDASFRLLFDVAEEILGAQEKASAGTLVPDKLELFCESLDLCKSFVS